MRKYVLAFLLCSPLFIGCQTLATSNKSTEYNDIVFSCGEETVVFQGSDIRSIMLKKDRVGIISIIIELDEDGTLRFADLTKRNVQKELTMSVSGRTIVSAKLLEPILDGKMRLSGYQEIEAEEVYKSLIKK